MSLSGSLSSQVRGGGGMQQATGVMGWQWSHLACSPILLESLLSSGLLSWQDIPKILPTHAYSLWAISRPYREEHRRKDPSYPMSCYTFPVRPVLQSCRSLSYSEKKGNNSFVLISRKRKHPLSHLLCQVTVLIGGHITVMTNEFWDPFY